MVTQTIKDNKDAIENNKDTIKEHKVLFKNNKFLYLKENPHDIIHLYNPNINTVTNPFLTKEQLPLVGLSLKEGAEWDEPEAWTKENILKQTQQIF